MTGHQDRLPTLFIPHGGGPWPFIRGMMGPPETWDGLAAHLSGLSRALGMRPRAVLVVSGHWEEGKPTVMVGRQPPLLYDYHGFPEHTYRLSYPAPGSPEVAARTRSLLAAAGIDSGEDAERGFDHGVFIPFMLIYPEADVPLVQLSLRQDLDPKAHLAIGRALAPLRDEGVLIAGSGMSYHNLRKFQATDPQTVAGAEAFDAWLTDAVEQPDAPARAARLAAWSDAPAARAAHPREEHLVPLFVAAGAAGSDRGRRIYHDRILAKPLSGYRFG